MIPNSMRLGFQVSSAAVHGCDKKRFQIPLRSRSLCSNNWSHCCCCNFDKTGYFSDHLFRMNEWFMPLPGRGRK
ncbi:unnamed protein product [Victoria cruziana]